MCSQFVDKHINSKGLNPIPQQAYAGLHKVKDDMKTTNEKADVIISQHVVNAVKQGTNCINVRCDDTGVFALLLYFYVQEK